MSVRLIGTDSRAPANDGSYLRSGARVMRMSTEPSEHEEKRNKASKYREELDKQVQELRRRREAEKAKEREENERIQRQFYENVQNSRVSAPRANRNKLHLNQENYKGDNFHFNRIEAENPQQNDEDAFEFGSKIARIGKNKYTLDVPVRHNRSDLIVDDEQNYEHRRRSFNQDMDRSLMDAYLAIERSRQACNTDLSEQLDRFRHKLHRPARIHTEFSVYADEPESFYSLPYRSPALYARPRHYRRDSAWH